MNIEDCLNEGLLKEDAPDLEKAKRSIDRAKEKLELAKREKAAGIFESAVVAAYSSMFHAARALLFRDGFKEKSHYGLFVYIKEKYGNKLELRFINELNSLRLERHELMYGLEPEEIEEQETTDTIGTARDFLSAVERILNAAR